MRELVSELTPRWSCSVSLPRDSACGAVRGVRAAGVSLPVSELSRSPARSRWEGGCDNCVAVGFRGRWWRVGGATLCLGHGRLVVGGGGLDWYLTWTF